MSVRDHEYVEAAKRLKHEAEAYLHDVEEDLRLLNSDGIQALLADFSYPHDACMYGQYMSMLNLLDYHVTREDVVNAVLFGGKPPFPEYETL